MLKSYFCKHIFSSNTSTNCGLCCNPRVAFSSGKHEICNQTSENSQVCAMNTWLEWQSEAWPRMREHQGTGRVWVCVSVCEYVSKHKPSEEGGRVTENKINCRGGKVKWHDSGRQEGICEEPQEGPPMVPWQLLQNTQKEEVSKLHPWQVWAEVPGMVLQRCEFQPKACSSVALGCTMEAEVSCRNLAAGDTTESYPYAFCVGFMLWEEGPWPAVPIHQQGEGEERWSQGHSLSFPCRSSRSTKRMNKGHPLWWSCQRILPRFSSRGSPSLQPAPQKEAIFQAVYTVPG